MNESHYSLALFYIYSRDGEASLAAVVRMGVLGFTVACVGGINQA